MNIFIKATVCVLLALILSITLSKNSKDFSLLLCLFVCSVTVIAAVQCLAPVVSFMNKLQEYGKLNSEMVQILLKSVGIGFLAEIVSLICTDAGNAALGKTLKFLASAIILMMAIPLLDNLITLIEEILGAV